MQKLDLMIGCVLTGTGKISGGGFAKTLAAQIVQTQARFTNLYVALMSCG